MTGRQPSRHRFRLFTAGSRFDWLPAMMAAQLSVAFVLGGSSARNDVALMAIELATLPLLAVTLWRSVQPGAPRFQLFPLVLLAAFFLLPLIQLIPIPPELWRVLPGRARAVDSLTLAGAGRDWLPLSLTPDATWRTFLWLVPPATLFLASTHLTRGGRLALAVAIVALSGLSLVIGALQFAGADMLQVSSFSDPRMPNGLFANRNHHAIAMVVGLPLTAAAIADWSRASAERRKLASSVFIAISALLVIGALSTLSRAGLVLGGVGLVGGLAVFYRSQTARSGQRRQAVWVMAATVLVVIAIAQFGLAAVLSRFDGARETELRFQFWPTIAATADRYFPTGAGLGAFDPVYRSVEPPQTVDDTFVNAAHNDFLQIWLEGGALGLALLLATLIWLTQATIRVWRSPPSISDTLALGASVALWVLIAHSLADYPLRTPALACVFAVLCGIMARAKSEPAVSPPLQKKNSPMP